MLKNFTETESREFLKRFELDKNINSNEKNLASLYNFYASTSNSKYSITIFCKNLKIRRQTFSEKLKSKGIILNPLTKLFEENEIESKLQEKNIDVLVEKKRDFWYLDEIYGLKNELKELEKKYVLLEEKINKFAQDKNNWYGRDIRLAKSSQIQIHDYLDFDAKPLVRAFEVYDLIFNYFRFMIKNFDNRLQREVLNQLLVDFGENLIPNSFAIYCEFMSNTNDDQKDLSYLKETLQKLKENDKIL
jgi:hypothetical protein